tara:strand:+ start:323 stop:1456 length:1134 start_codon:yes stop_codon:yes gene_type:complete
MTRVDQQRTNPSKAISNFKGRWETVFGWPSTAISTWLNGGLFGGDINVSYTVTSGSAATVDYTDSGDGLNYRSLTFTSTSQITFDQTTELKALLVSGGGGGGDGGQSGSGGGGAGGHRVHTDGTMLAVTASEGLTITIGAGGAGAAGSAGADGGTTSITVTSGGAVKSTVLGGGKGTHGDNTSGAAAPSGGGSGSGANTNGLSGFVAGGAGSTYGNSGGNSRYTSNYPGYLCAGGGGGAGGGGNRIVSFTWPVFSFGASFACGGEGATNDFRTGSNEYRAGGGANHGAQYGYGGDGSFALKGGQNSDGSVTDAGGGDGYTNYTIQNTASVLGTTSEANAAATANTGGGGGGVFSNVSGEDGGPGGSGIVIIKIPYGN